MRPVQLARFAVVRNIFTVCGGMILAACALAGMPALAATPTTTTLAASSNNVTAATVVTMTATVANPAPVTRGTVLFCNASVSQCTPGRGLYGSAQLTGAGSAVLRLRFSTGVYGIQARFVGTTTNVESTSLTNSISVSSQQIYTSSTVLNSSGGAGNYSLFGTVAGFGGASVQGSVAFLDTTNANAQIGTASLSPSSPSWLAPVSYDSGTYNPAWVVAADLNGDGIPDVVTVGSSQNFVSVLLGNADGTLQALTTYPAGNSPTKLAIGDFNGDGNADIAVSNTSPNTVSILLGNGDGTFQSPVSYGVSGGPTALVVGDFNHDGNQDLAVVGGTGSALSILLGNGDGTFGAATSYPTGNVPTAVAVGDFNGDGFQDLAVTNGTNQSVSIFLGVGDGTFRTQVTYATGYGPWAVAVADFDGDGHLDLVVGNHAVNTLSVLLGNGDGTFRTQVTYATNNPVFVAVADLNGDGNPDVVATNYNNNTISVFQGNGNGTFKAGVAYPSGDSPNPASIAIGDFNGDGNPDFVIANAGGNTVSTVLGEQVSSYTANGVAVLGTGTHSVLASFSGDNSRTASSSPTVALTATQLTTPAVTVSCSPNPIVWGATSSCTAHVSSGTGNVVFTGPGPDAVETGPWTVPVDSNGNAVLTGFWNWAARIYTLTATYTGDTNDAPASGTATLTINKATPTITWATPAAINYGTSLSGTQLNATSGVVGAFVYTPASGTVLSAGTDTLSVTFYPSDTTDYSSATTTVNLTVNKTTPVILAWPTASTIIYRQTLASSTLSGGSGQVERSITTVAGNGTGGYSGDGGAATSAELYSPAGVAVDSAGNIYIADFANNRIRMVSASTGAITTVAGNGTPGFSGDGGAATNAELYNPAGVAVDSAGNIYIADNYNNRIRMVSASTGVITTVAGNGTRGFSGDGGAATNAELNYPNGVAVDSAGNIYIADFYNHRIRMVSASTGAITTVAGNGTPGYSGDGGAATSAELYNPAAVALDSAGNIYIVEFANNLIRMVSASTGAITTVAGNGTGGYSGDGGAATNAELYYPAAVALDSAGNIYIADAGNNRVRAVPAISAPGAFAWTTPSTVPGLGTSSQSVTFTPTDTIDYNTVTGSVSVTTVNKPSQTITFSPPPSPVTYGVAPITLSATASSGLTVSFSVVSGPAIVSGNILTITGAGTVVVAANQSGNSSYAAAPQVTQTIVVMKATPVLSFPFSGWIQYGTLVSSTQLCATANVPGTFTYSPLVIGQIAPLGNTYVYATFTPTDTTDYYSGGTVGQWVQVSQITVNLSWPGSGPITYGTPLSAAQLNASSGGVPGTFVYSPAIGTILNAGTYTLKVNFTPTDTTHYATPPQYSLGLTVNKQTLRVSPNSATKVYGTANPPFSGSLIGLVAGDNITATYSSAATLSTPAGVYSSGTYAVTATLSDPDSRLSNYTFVNGLGTFTITKAPSVLTWTTPAAIAYGTSLSGLQLAASSGGIPGSFVYSPAAGNVLAPGIYTLSTTFTPSDSVDYTAASASVSLAIEPNGAAILSPYEITTVAGTGISGYTGDTGPATSAEISSNSYGVVADAVGQVFFADTENNVVRKIDVFGKITTVAGNGTAGYTGDNGPATAAELNHPTGVAVDGLGNLYITDTANHVVRKVAGLTITTIAGTGVDGYTGDGGPATNAELDAPSGMTIAPNDTLLLCETNYSTVRAISLTTGVITTIAGNQTSGYSGDGGIATSAQLNGPRAAVEDLQGNIYIADSGNSAIRKIAAGTNVITTLAGNGTPGFSGDGGPAGSALVNQPAGITLDPAGNIYFTDSGNGLIRTISTAGIINTVAGTTVGYSGDGGPALSATLSNAKGISFSPFGTIYFSDTTNNRIRQLGSHGVLAFGSQPVATTSAALSAVITNAGMGTLSFTANPTSTGDFAIATGNTCGAAGTNLGAGDSCSLQVKFRPTAAGVRTGSITVTDDSYANTQQQLMLTGTGTQASQTITFTPAPSPVTYGVAPIALSATASSGLGVTFSVLSGPAIVTGNTLTITGAGTVVVAANQSGNSSYSPAPQVTNTIVVNQATATITVTSSKNPSNYGDMVTFTVNATGAAGVGTPTGTVAISDGGTLIGTVTLNASGTATTSIQTLVAGSHTLTAAYGGDSNYK